MTGRSVLYDGIKLDFPNDIIFSNEEFYISYNDRDISLYGCDTTALVDHNMTKFLVLNGDHRPQYSEIISKGGRYEECEKYFIQNQHLKSKMSDRVDAIREMYAHVD